MNLWQIGGRDANGNKQAEYWKVTRTAYYSLNGFANSGTCKKITAHAQAVQLQDSSALMAKQEWREGVQKHKADTPGPLCLD